MECRLHKCCLCIELRTGCLIIGYMNLIGNIILILTSILALSAANAVITHGQDEAERKMAAALFTMIIVVLVFLILFLVFSIILLVGLHKSIRNLIKIYIIYALFFIVLYTVMLIVNIISERIDGISLGKDIFSILLQMYFLLVIWSYYLEMGQLSGGDPYYNAA